MRCCFVTSVTKQLHRLYACFFTFHCGVVQANPQAVMLDSKNLVPTHYNILRDDKNPLQLLKVFMERGKQSHLEESSDSSSSSDEAEIVREAEDESGLFVSTSSLPTSEKQIRVK